MMKKRGTKEKHKDYMKGGTDEEWSAKKQIVAGVHIEWKVYEAIMWDALWMSDIAADGTLIREGRLSSHALRRLRRQNACDLCKDQSND